MTGFVVQGHIFHYLLLKMSNVISLHKVMNVISVT